jgi:hypothetical protein
MILLQVFAKTCEIQESGGQVFRSRCSSALACGSMVLYVYCVSFFALQGEK